jgi:hypothetical protein
VRSKLYARFHTILNITLDSESAKYLTEILTQEYIPLADRLYDVHIEELMQEGLLP